MAELITYQLRSGGCTYRVKWRAGGSRDGKRETETFNDPAVDNEKLAKFFKADVERHDHQYPPNFVPKFGYVDPQVLAEEKARLAVEADRAKVVQPVYFEDRYKTFLETRTAIEDRSLHDYEQQFANHLLPAFGELVVNAAADVPDEERFDGDKIKAWVNRTHRGVKDRKTGKVLVESRSAKTVRNLHALLSSYCAWLVEKNLLIANPCVGTQLPESEDGEADVEMVFLEHAEFALLLDCAGADAKDLIEFLVGTGLRYSEATALKVKYVRLKNPASPYLLVRKAWKRQVDGSHEEGKPKSRASRRRVELVANTPVINLLARLIAGRDAEEYVFLAPTGVHWRHNNFYNRPWLQTIWKAARCDRHRAEDGITNMHLLKRRHVIPCGCPGTLTSVPRIHDLRHTCAAWLIEGGVSLVAIQRQFGHESYNTTEKRYAHLTARAKEQMGEAIAAARAPARPSVRAGVAATASALITRQRPLDRRSRRQRILASVAAPLPPGRG